MILTILHSELLLTTCRNWLPADGEHRQPFNANDMRLPKTTSWRKWKQKLNNGHQASPAELLDLRNREQLTGWRAPETAAHAASLDSRHIFGLWQRLHNYQDICCYNCFFPAELTFEIAHLRGKRALIKSRNEAKRAPKWRHLTVQTTVSFC